MSSPFLTSWPTLSAALQTIPDTTEPRSMHEQRELLARMRDSLQQPLKDVGVSIRGEWAREPSASRQIQQLEIDLMASLSLLTEDLGAKQRERSPLHCNNVMRMAAQVNLLGDRLFKALLPSSASQNGAREVNSRAGSSREVDLEPFVEIQLGPDTPLVDQVESVRPRCPKVGCTLL